MEDVIKFEGITASFKTLTDNKAIINVSPNQIGKILLDWNKLDYSDIQVEINENSTVEILELNERSNAKISYLLKENSNVKLNVFSKENAGDIEYEFLLEKGACLLVAYADFTSGKKELKSSVKLNGPKANCQFHLAALSRNDDHKTFTINFDHLVGDTYARMDNYGVCKNTATMNFLGDALVRKGAKKASTGQNAKIMLFDPTCHAKASPMLCIYENDIEAFHGASEGQINQEHVFYLTSRGLSEEEAKRLITFGYLYPIMAYFNDENIKKDIEDCIVNRV